jgi:hypothetical protein
MSFSFNPGQQPQTGEPMSGGGLTPPVVGQSAVAGSAPAVPDSAFLFMQQRGQEMTMGAYLQVVLGMISVLAVAVSIVLFAYSMYLTTSINSKKEEILTRDASFKELPITEMKRVSLRYATLDSLLKDYLSVRTPLKMLEDVVEKEVVFDKFTLMRNSQYTMNFSVVTTNYRALIQQLESLNLAQYSKVTNQPKIGMLADTGTSLKVEISAPVSAQGVLADSINFIPVQTEQNKTVSTSTSH